MIKTHVILDGLQDAAAAERLSVNWTTAGFGNAVDMSGQRAALWWGEGESGSGEAGLTEEQIDEAARLARVFGVELRDRVGKSFVAGNELGALRKQMVMEYQRRVAVAMMFGLPAVLLHYLGPSLAGASSARQMALPWLIEGIMAVWVAVAAGWVIIWQGLFSLWGLRATGDLLTTVIVLGALLPTAMGLLAMPFVEQPWLVLGVGEGMRPCFDVAVWAVLLAVLQRRVAYGSVERIEGRGDMMIPKFGMLVGGWLLVMLLATVLGDLRMGLAVGLLLPPMISLGGVNRWSPGVNVLLPVLGFAVVFLMGSKGFAGMSVRGVEVEVAAGFSLMMTVVMGLGWKGYNSVHSP